MEYVSYQQIIFYKMQLSFENVFKIYGPIIGVSEICPNEGPVTISNVAD